MMIGEQIYFSLKPFMPWRLRIALRRMRAQRRRRTYADVWPIDPRSANVPANWPGWPEGKQFAVVLTHDVEGAKGLARVCKLMEVERKYGFRSSFNFVPEGDYTLDEALRANLEQNGFEVGVHGLTHDGKLYSSKKAFAKSAAQIRKYVGRWRACGFRSPLMQHRLSWLHSLGVEYDASTFDTDPFEPEPDGVGTIFPFWVPGLDGSGFVELPYTLIQDFNLFIVLRERNIDIWTKKLDWLVKHGGMALLNTHPDYMCFEGEPARDEYPVSHYEEFLKYLEQKYAGMYWTARPKDVAQVYRKGLPLRLRNSRKKICMIAYTFYELDNRVRRYAETLARRGDQVDVIALSGIQFQAPIEEIKGVRVYRIQHREYNEGSKWTYAERLLRFLFRSARFLSQLHQQNRYDVIHIHNMPDFLAFAAWYPKLTGATVILDIHDIVPELFSNKFETNSKHAYIKALKVIEKASAAFADHVIVSNHLWRDTLVSRSVSESKCSVFLNHVDPAIFYPRPRTRQDDRFIILFPGSLQWHQGLDIAIKAFVKVKEKVPKAEFHIYGGGGGDKRAELEALAQALGIAGSVKFFDGIALDRIADVIANADLGVVPKRADSFGNEAYSTKIMEFMSQGVPVVASRTKIDSFYFDEGLVHFFESGDSNAMAEAVLDVINDPNLRRTMIERGLEYAHHNSWDQKKQDYLDLVDSLSTEHFGALSTRTTYEREPEQGSATRISPLQPATLTRPSNISAESSCAPADTR